MPQIWKLYGIVQDINANNILIGGHNDSVEKLKKLNLAGKNPLKDNKFYVVFKEEAVIPMDIIKEKVVVWVHIKKYRFRSTYENNKNELIEGWKLHLVKIEKNRDY
jgi:hypothetical protein